jgi:transcriptional regulator with XRE-family HTH domain
VTKSSRGPFCRPGKEQGKTALGDRLKQERLRRGFKLNEFADLVGEVLRVRTWRIPNEGGGHFLLREFLPKDSRSTWPWPAK